MNCNTSTQAEGNSQSNFLNSEIHFATIDEAKKLMSTSDEFTKSLSPFDFVAKTQDTEKNTEVDYLNYAADQARDWTKKDIADNLKVLAEAEKLISDLGLNLNLPSKIVIINSTCKEEGGAKGYTRGDFIVVDGKPDLHLFLHELWHIISRKNPTIKDDAYAVIGFKKMKRAVFPPELEKLRITNPDAPFMDHYITVQVDGEDKNTIITTMASAPYTEGSFFKYLMIVMYEVEFNEDHTTVISTSPYTMAQTTGLIDQIGSNTNYIIHPEEITAEHFTMLVLGSEVKSPELIEGLRKVLNK